MNTVSVRTTQNIELEFDLASLGERLVAWLIDVLIFGAYFFIISFIINVSSLDRLLSRSPWLTFFIAVPFVFYNLVCEIWLNGQTVGKRVMKVKVISLNGTQATFGQYLLRWLFRIIDIFMSNGLVAFICIAVSQKKQRLGDMVAGTTVIKTEPRVAFQDTLFVPTQETYTVSFPEVVQLRDSDVQLIKEVQLNVYRSGNTMLAYHTAEKIKQLLDIQSPLEPLHFLNVVLADYNHLASKL